MTISQLSPFSLQHNWSVNWSRALKIRGTERIIGESQKELLAMQALSAVNVIGLGQLFKRFGIDRKRAEKMCAEKKLVKHVVYQNRQNMVIYTLGEIGAKIINEPNYQIDYWLQYGIKDVLKRLAFYNLFLCFDNAKVERSLKPFTGIIKKGDTKLFVYVLRDQGKDLEHFLLYHDYFTERVIIVAEEIDHLNQLLPTLIESKIKLRVALDMDIYKQKEKSIRDKFYYLDKTSRKFMLDLEVE